MNLLGNSQRLAVAMTAHTDHLHLLTRELASRSASPTGRRAMNRFRDAGIELGHATSLVDLVAWCHAIPTAEDNDSGATLEGLLVLAPTDPDAALVALVSLRPALCRIITRVCGQGLADDDAVAEVVTTAWEAICDPTLGEGLRMRRIVLATWIRARSQRRRQLNLAAQDEPLDEEWDRVLVGSDPADDQGRMLELAVRRGTITPDEAAVIALTRVGGATVSELAASKGVPAFTIFSIRRRAEAKIRDSQ
jgi:DNA-directed RNA polymerase specialized sigma24 family protein